MNVQRPPGGIEWTRVWGWPGFTWPAMGGCSHGCMWRMPDGDIARCYAKEIALRFTNNYQHGFEHHYWREHNLEAPLKMKKPAGIFLDAMSDLMDLMVPDEHVDAILNVCRRADWHVFQLLTKNAPRLLDFDIPPNVWVGVSSPPDWMYDPDNYAKELSERAKDNFMHKALKVLAQVDVPVKWMSFEPLQRDFSQILFEHPKVINWAVIGAASNGRTIYPPDPVHFSNMMEELDTQRVPVFFKGNMSKLPEAVAEWREDFPDEEWYLSTVHGIEPPFVRSKFQRRLT